MRERTDGSDCPQSTLPKYWIRHRADSGHDRLLLLRLNYVHANETTANWMRRWWLAGDWFSRHVGVITRLYVICSVVDYGWGTLTSGVAVFQLQI